METGEEERESEAGNLQRGDEIQPDHRLNYSGLPFPHLSFYLYSPPQVSLWFCR